MVRLLPHYGERRKPKLYLRPPLGFRGACVEAVIRSMERLGIELQFFWWKTGRVREIELLAVLPAERIGFRFVAKRLVRPRDWWPLRIAHRRGVIHRGFLLHEDDQAFVTARVVQALPVEMFLKEFERWIIAGSGR